jgi:hypothetical protein
MRILGHRSARFLLSVALASLLPAGCASAGEDDALAAETPDPEDLEGATDSFFRPTEHGDLRLGSQEGVHATLAPDAGYHAWFFDVPGEGGATSRIALATDRDDREGAGTGKELDTVLYLYRQGEDGGWGRYIGKNDDRDATTRFSELSERELAPGRYRVIVKGARECTSRASARSPYCGSFVLTSLCLAGPACASEGPTPSDCEAFDGAIDECQGLHAEPFDVCLELASIARGDLLACCEADDHQWTFCPVPDAVDPAVLERCQGWATDVVDCESAGHDVAQCGAEHGFTMAELSECCAADDVFYFCSLE